MKKTIVLSMLAVALVGCGTVNSTRLSYEGPDFIGKPADDLFAEKGAPLRQITSPTGATVYVYEAHNLFGGSFCEGSFYTRDGKVVGFSAKGLGLTCGGSAGDIQ